MNAIALEQIQSELKYAFKWMARATCYAKQGDFCSASHCTTVAQQHWNNCQHERDKYINDEQSEKIHWDFITMKAADMAKKELEKELKDEQENA